MKQIVLNYLQIFILPFALGLIVRLILRNRTKGYIATIVLAVVTVALCLCTAFIDTHGDETLGLLAIQAAFSFIGSLIVGAIQKIINRKRKISAT